MSALISAITVLCAAVVLVRVICIGPRMRFGMDSWRGQTGRFAVFTLALAGLGASSFAVAAGLPFSGQALLVSVAGLIVSDRRMTR